MTSEDAPFDLAAALGSDASVRAFNAMGYTAGNGTPGPMQMQIELDMRLFRTVIRERNWEFDTWPVYGLAWVPRHRP